MISRGSDKPPIPITDKIAFRIFVSTRFVGGNRTSRGWQPVDITSYGSFSLEARATPAPRTPLLIRFEDDSASAAGGSTWQSTNWHELNFGREFQEYEIKLSDFDWWKRAFFWNTAPVNKERVVLLVLGHDPVAPTCAGVIEVRHLKLTPRKSDKALEIAGDIG